MYPVHMMPLLWVFCRAEPPDPCVLSPRALDDLRDEGFIVKCPTSGSGYELTTKGSVFVKALLAVPTPIQKWIIPTVAQATAHTPPTKDE